MIMSLERAHQILFLVSMLTLSVTVFTCLFRAILGPRFTDRVMSVNVIGTKAVAMIALLSFLLDEEGLIDIAVVYAMISFLAIVILSRCYLHKRHIAHRNEPSERDDALEGRR